MSTGRFTLFEDEELDRSKQIEFYQHEMGWVNRLILGDSLVVMTSLLEKERLGGQVQMIYIDPPYGINFNSNFQARISDRAPTETRDETISREPEQIPLEQTTAYGGVLASTWTFIVWVKRAEIPDVSLNAGSTQAPITTRSLLD